MRGGHLIATAIEPVDRPHPKSAHPQLGVRPRGGASQAPDFSPPGPAQPASITLSQFFAGAHARARDGNLQFAHAPSDGPVREANDGNLAIRPQGRSLKWQCTQFGWVRSLEATGWQR